ncbi:MAG: polysaccharide biosynthesis/export family protein [Deltaproteobacteria bacterium]
MRQISRYLRIVLAAQLILAFAAFPVRAQDTKEDAESYYKLGKVYYEQGRYKEAEELFQKSLDILAKEQEKKETAEAQVPAPAPRQEETVRVPQPSVPAVPARAVPVRPAFASGRQEYVIGGDDVLQVNVWQNQDLDGELIVRPDGMISFPLVGDVEAEGQTLTQLKKALTERLGEYVKAPVISVSIKKLGGSRVIMLGQVVTPGVYSVAGGKSIMEAIGMAGGFTRDAVPSSTVVIRGGFQNAKAMKLNLSKVFTGDLKENVSLQSQDIVFVPRKFISDLNYFLNQVLEPLARGAYVNHEVQEW